MTTNILSPEGFKKYSEDLEYLRTVKRRELSIRLQEAMEDGELIESAEYEAAKNEQGIIEGRIKELEILLANAQIVEKSKSTSKVAVNSKVTIQYNDKDTPETYELLGTAEANPMENKISVDSPVGHAILGKKVGDKVKVVAPGGTFVIEIIAIG